MINCDTKLSKFPMLQNVEMDSIFAMQFMISSGTYDINHRASEDNSRDFLTCGFVQKNVHDICLEML